MQTSGNSLFLWVSVFPFNFTQEQGLALLAVFGLIGLFDKLSRGEYLLPVWVVLPFFINPRSSARAAILPLTILATTGLLDVILPTLGKKDPPSQTHLLKITRMLFWGYLLIYLLANNYGLAQRMGVNFLEESDRQAMAWIRENTPTGSKFIVLTREPNMMRDPIQEWFPTLSERNSQTTLQGREWLDGKGFMESIVSYQKIKNCLDRNQDCIEEQKKALGLDFDHIYIKAENAQRLIDSLESTTTYRRIYDKENVVLFEILPEN
jgi:hypothetical protein